MLNKRLLLLISVHLKDFELFRHVCSVPVSLDSKCVESTSSAINYSLLACNLQIVMLRMDMNSTLSFSSSF